MTKQLIIGLSTIVVAGAALLTTGMYAANMSSTETNTTRVFHMNSQKGENLINTLSGKISAPALKELEALMTKHKTEMDTLMTKYPEIKSTIPQKGFNHGKGGKNDEIQKIMNTLPESVQSEIKNIRTSYEKKEEALRNEEKTQIDTILAAYPDIKSKLNTARSQTGKHMMGFQRGNR